jgi:hypothetical protein
MYRILVQEQGARASLLVMMGPELTVTGTGPFDRWIGGGEQRRAGSIDIMAQQWNRGIWMELHEVECFGIGVLEDGERSAWNRAGDAKRQRRTAGTFPPTVRVVTRRWAWIRGKWNWLEILAGRLGRLDRKQSSDIQ